MMTSRAGNEAIAPTPIRQSQPSGRTAGSMAWPDSSEKTLFDQPAAELVLAFDELRELGRLRRIVGGRSSCWTWICASTPLSSR